MSLHWVRRIHPLPVSLAVLLLATCGQARAQCLCPPDMNQDGHVDGNDVTCFVRCLLPPSTGCLACACADLDGSGTVTTADVVPFVAALLNGLSGCPGQASMAAQDFPLATSRR